MAFKKNIQPNSKRALCLLIAVLAAVLCLLSVPYTYARFFSTESANMSLDIAKWAVALKQNSQPLAQTFDVKFTATENEHVAPNKFAPSSELSAELVLDLTGTEVSVDYRITADTSVFGERIASGDISLSVMENNSPATLGKETYLPLATLQETPTRTFKFVLTWAEDGEQSATDKDFAKEHASVTVPVSIRVRQHIDGTDLMDDRKVSSSLSYAETTQYKTRTTLLVGDPYDKQDILSDNPERGFYSTSLLKLTENGTDPAYVPVEKSSTSKLLQLKVDLSAFSGSMNGTGEDKALTSAAINELDALLGKIKENDNTVILRFYYDDFASGEDDPKVKDVEKVEPQQDMLLKHIQSLGETFKKYKTTIDVIQVGFYGLWGECYYKTDATTKGEEFYPATVNALLDATEGTEITIAVRTPQYYEWYKAKGVHADDARVGIFNDAYGASENDMGTYTDRTEETDWLGIQSAHNFYGGEALPEKGALGIYNTPSYFVTEAYKLHTSYLNWEWDQALHKLWKDAPYTGSYAAYDTNALAYIESHLGYRFVVKDVKTYATAVPGESLPIDITILNTGFGNLVKSKQCDIVLVAADGTATEFENVAIDAKKFTSGAQITQSINVALPLTLTQGKYKIYLRMSSGEKLGSSKYYSAVRFANDNMWNETLQANYIAQVEITA